MTNRLVAAELELRWEAALIEQRQAEEALGRLRQKQPSRLTSQEEQRIKALATDIPQLWRAETTTGIERQTVLRALLEAVTVEVVGTTERMLVTLRWAGGFESHHEIHRAVGRFEQLEATTLIQSRIAKMKQQGLSNQAVAVALNADGFHATNGGPFAVPIVKQISSRMRKERPITEPYTTSCNIWTMTSLSRHLPLQELNSGRVDYTNARAQNSTRRSTGNICSTKCYNPV